MRHNYHLVDLSKHHHDPKHHLKKHIFYNHPGEHLDHSHVMHHIGLHTMPHNYHKISIHHHEGHHHYYDKHFGSHEEAKSHIKKYFKFTDAYPDTVRLAKNIAPLASAAATASGSPLLGAGIQAVGEAL